MDHVIDYWDAETQSQKQRIATAEESAQIEIDRAQAANPIIPRQVTPMQAKFALAQMGLYQSVVDALSALPEPNKIMAKIAWDSAQDFKRDNPLVLMIAQVLDWTEKELDDLFKLAATL